MFKKEEESSSLQDGLFLSLLMSHIFVFSSLNPLCQFNELPPAIVDRLSFKAL